MLGLASLAGMVFVIFLTRVFLLGPPEPPLRTCGPSAIYASTGSAHAPTFEEIRRKYHFVMEALIEERMNLYEGTTLLACNAKAMDDVIPPGQFATKVAEVLRQNSFQPPPPADYFSPFLYADFEKLLLEFWRTYDCHLFAVQTNPGLFGETVPLAEPDQETTFGSVTGTNEDVIEQERLRARSTLDRLLFVLRSSEQYLPLHASLRCLQRGGTDVRNALALLSDANQCLMAKIGQPETSLLK